MRHNVKVCIDDVIVVEAYAIADDTWNGFAVPYFTREQADELAAKMAASDPSYGLDRLVYAESIPDHVEANLWNHGGDGYAHEYVQDGEWGWDEGMTMPGEPNGPRVYGIGAYEWAWSVAK